MFDLKIQSWKLLFCLMLVSIYSCQPETKPTPLKIETVRIGSDIKLVCSAVNVENEKNIIDIHWEHNNVIIGKGRELYLKNVQLKDVGKYVCRSSEKIESGLVAGEKSTITEQDQVVVEQENIPNIVISQLDAAHNTIRLEETQNLDIECSVSNWSRNEYNVQWIKSDGYAISNNQRLLIESVLKKQHENTYTCAIVHKTQPTQVFRKDVILKISQPAVQIQILASEKLIINGLIHRKCVGFKLAESTERFSYYWIDSQGRTISKTDTIQVPINDESVFGQYECHYRAHKSGKTFIATVNIIAESASSTISTSYSITITPYPQKFRLNEKFSMRCQVAPELKQVQYSWYHDNQLLENNHQTITFDSFTRSKLGVYKCKIVGLDQRNQKVELEAKSYQRLSFFVPIKVELIEGAGSQVAVIMSRKKELHCEISADSENSGSDVQWKFQNQELSTQDSLNKFNIARVNGRLVSILVLNNAQMQNEGHYQCQVGEVTKAVNIIIIQDDGVLAISPAIEKRLEGQPGEFHCRVNNIPNVKNTDIKWYFVRKDGSERIAMPNKRWTTYTGHVADRTSFIGTDSAEMEDNGYFICTIPSGQETQAEFIVEKRFRPFVAKVSPPVLNVRKRQKFEFECFTQDKVGNPVGEPSLRFLNGSLVSKDKRFQISKVGPSRIRLVAPFGIDIDAKQLQMTCGVREIVAYVTINVQDICPPNHRYCRSGECVSNQKFCDGIVDCKDGSDEDISYCNSCDPVQKACGPIIGNSTVEKYNIDWACNGEDDCKNGFDEKHCDASDKCKPLKFTCSNGDKMPYGYVCDGTADCKDGEDEIGCAKPIIVSTSMKDVRASLGTTVKLTCEVAGHPLPAVTWRFNWNCLPDESRMKIGEIKNNCDSFVSVLTINDFKPGDDAIYHCEAVSGRDRAFSKPFQVTLDN